MGKIFLTGASGHLGANLLQRLLADGADVRVLLREGSDNRAVDGLPVERIYGDLRDPAAVDKAVQGCSRIYHTAAMVSTLYGDPTHKRAIFDSNVLGTRHVLQAAARHGSERVVVTSSLGAVGYDEDLPHAPSTEESPFYPFHRTMPYEASKAFVEHECLRAVARGLDVRVAVSCAILGPHDFKPSRMGRALCDFANRTLRAYIDGGVEFVAANDIVQGHLLTMEKGKPGEKYIFSTQFATLPEIMTLWHEITGVPKPRVKLPVPLMAAAAEIISPLLTRFAPQVPQRLTPGAVRILQLRRHVDVSKARSQLGYQPTSIRRACEDAYQHFCQRGVISRA